MNIIMNYFLISVHQNNAQFGWNKFSATVNMDVVTCADVFNVNWYTGILCSTDSGT